MIFDDNDNNNDEEFVRKVRMKANRRFFKFITNKNKHIIIFTFRKNYLYV